MPNTVIQLKKSSTPGSSPSTGNLANGELAINFADGVIYYKNLVGQVAQFTAPGKNFGTVNANGTLLVSAIAGDVFTILPGQNITVTGDAVNDRVTIGVDLTSANGWANTKLSNGTVTLAGALTTTGSIYANGVIYVTPVGGQEGGEIKLQATGSNTNWNMDSYQNNFRLFAESGTTVSNVNFFHAIGGSIRMGVNRADPGYTLDVNGVVNASAIYVNGSPISNMDYPYANLVGSSANAASSANDASQGANIAVLAASFVSNSQSLSANVNTLAGTFVSANANAVSLSTNVAVLAAAVVANDASQGANIATLAATFTTANSGITVRIDGLSTLSNTNAASLSANVNTLAASFVSNSQTLSANVNTLAATFVSANANNISLSANVNVLAAVAAAALANTSGVSFNGNLNFPTGNVGIGTTTPTATLHVQGNANITLPNLVVGGTNVIAAIVAANANAVTLSSNVNTLATSFVSNSQSLSANVNTLAATFSSANANSVSLSANVNVLAAAVVANDASQGANIAVLAASFVSNSQSLSANVNTLAATFVSANANSVSLSANVNVLSANVNTLAGAAYPKTGGTISGDVTVTGSLTVSGATTYVNTQTLLIGDNLVTLNADLPGNVQPTENAGLEINRGARTSNAAFIWNENANSWQFTSNTLAGVYSIIASQTDANNVGAAANNFAAATYLTQSAFNTANANSVSQSANVNVLAASFVSNSQSLSANVNTLAATFASANANSVSLSANVNVLAAAVVANNASQGANIATLAASFVSNSQTLAAYATTVGASANSYASANYITSSGNISGYSGSIFYLDNRQISPSEDSNNRLKFGFTSWNNDGVGPYADYLHTRSYGDATGGNDNLIVFRKDQIGMRIWQQTFSNTSPYATYKDVAFITDVSGVFNVLNVAYSAANTNAASLSANVNTLAATFVSANANNVSLSANVNILAAAVVANDVSQGANIAVLAASFVSNTQTLSANVNTLAATFASANANNISLSANVNTLAATFVSANANNVSLSANVNILAAAVVANDVSQGANIAVLAASFVSNTQTLSANVNTLAATFASANANNISLSANVNTLAAAFASANANNVSLSANVNILAANVNTLAGSLGLANTTGTFAGALTTTGSITANNLLTLTPFDGVNEGGQINLIGAASNPNWTIDSYSTAMRIFTSGVGARSVSIFNASGGANTVDFYVTGNVAIGGASVAARMSIRNDRTILGYNQVWSTYNGASFENDTILGFNGSATYFGNFQNYPLIFVTNNTERMRIASDGNVAIGQATAPERLTVFRDTDNSAEFGRAHVGFVGHSDFAGFSHVDMNAAGNYALLQSSGGATYLNSASGVPIFFRQGNVDKMILNAAGNFGIGTTSPTQNLDVAGGAIVVRGGRVVPATGNGMIFDFGGMAGVANTGCIQGYDYGAAVARNVTMQIAGGNVGIGEPSPTYKLHVNGSFAANTKSFVIDHPTKPGMKLRYGSLEGPENGVYVRGKIEGNVIELPDYWTGLVHEDTITVQLTAIGRSQNPYVVEVSNNKVYIDTENHTEPYCFYHIYGERKDVEKLIVEY